MSTGMQGLPVGASGWRWLPLAALVIAIDQWTKALVERSFELYESHALLPVLDLTRAHNPGAAFSFLAGAGGWQRWFFSALAGAVSIAIIVWLRRLSGTSQQLLAAGLSLIVGGALGNLVDRVRHGYVVDFIHAHWQQAYFPAFNAADTAISIGAMLLLLDALLEWRRERGGQS